MQMERNSDSSRIGVTNEAFYVPSMGKKVSTCRDWIGCLGQVPPERCSLCLSMLSQIWVGEDGLHVCSLSLIRVKGVLHQSVGISRQSLGVARSQKLRVFEDFREHLLALLPVKGKAIMEHYEQSHPLKEEIKMSRQRKG